MKKSISKKNIIMKISIRKNCFFFLGLYIVYFLLSTCIHNVGDDLVFQKGIEQYGSLHGWIIFFSNNWSGRIIPQGILVALLQFPESIFHMINALMWVLLFTYVVKVYDIHRNFDMKKTIITISILTFSVIPKSVLSQATFWKCANVLYLWGSAMMLIVYGK